MEIEMRTKFKVAIAAALLAMPVATIVHPVDAATKVTVVKLKKSDFQPYRDPADGKNLVKLRKHIPICAK